MSAHLRIEQTGRVATDTKIVYVAADGTETDLSSCISGVELDMRVGEPVTATLEAFVGEVTVSGVHAEQILVDLERVQRARVPWFRRLRDLTTFGARYRRTVRA